MTETENQDEKPKRKSRKLFVVCCLLFVVCCFVAFIIYENFSSSAASDPGKFIYKMNKNHLIERNVE